MNLLLFMGNGVFIDSFGGAERVACTMANEFSRRGWNVTLVCNDLKAGLPAYHLKPEIDLVNINGTGKPLPNYTIPEWLKIGREITRPFRNLGLTFFFDLCDKFRVKSISERLDLVIRKAKPDVILPFFLNDLQALCVCRSTARIPIVQMMHDTPQNVVGVSSSAKRKALNRAACVQVLMKSFVPQLKKYTDCSALVIPNAVPQFPEQVVYRAETASRIVNIARLEPKQKQQHILIDAFALIADEFPNWTLHFYGEDQDGLYHQKLQNKIEKLGLQNRIFLEGTTDKVKEALLSADIFAFPSAWEGFGIALLEAMRVGLPAIGFRSAPAVNELIRDGENGLLADDGPKEFAEGLSRLMTNPQLREQLGRAARTFSENFAPEKIWDQWEALLTKTIDEYSAQQK